MQTSYNDIIPDEVQQQLIQLRDVITQVGWTVGDLTNYVIRHNAESGKWITKEVIYSAVGNLVGKASRTVREYAMMSAFYPVEHRETYEILAFDHFREAMRLNDHWREALDWCMEYAESHGGRPATVDAMVARFAFGREVGEEKPDAVEVGREDDNNNNEETAIVGDSRTVVYALRQARSSIDMILESNPPAEVREILLMVVSLLADIGTRLQIEKE